MHRLFIAVEVPKEVQQEIERIENILQKGNLFQATYTDSKKVHITLKFLGDVSEAVLPKINQALQTINMHSMQAILGSVGFFTTGNTIKVIYLNVLCPQVELLVHQINNVLLDFFEAEERNFVSHLTLARVKEVYDKTTLIQELGCIKVKPISFSIDSFILKKSVLTPDGPEYFDSASYQMN